MDWKKIWDATSKAVTSISVLLWQKRFSVAFYTLTISLFLFGINVLIAKEKKVALSGGRGGFFPRNFVESFFLNDNITELYAYRLTD